MNGSDVGFMMLHVEGRHCQSPAGCLMKMTLGLYCRPKRELLSPKSFQAETFEESYLTLTVDLCLLRDSVCNQKFL